MTYAKGTEVPVSRSRDEIERTLARYGASTFAYGWDGKRALVEFVVDDRRVRLTVPLADRDAHKFGPGYRTRTPAQGQTVGEVAGPQLDLAYSGETMLALMPGAAQ